MVDSRHFLTATEWGSTNIHLTLYKDISILEYSYMRFLAEVLTRRGNRTINENWPVGSWGSENWRSRDGLEKHCIVRVHFCRLVWAESLDSAEVRCLHVNGRELRGGSAPDRE